MGRVSYLFILIFVFYGVTLYAQERKIIQFSGLITSVGGELPVPFVTVTNKSYNNTAYAADNAGFFPFVAHVADTIWFISVDFDRLVYVIPHIASDKLTAMINMKRLVIVLPAVMPFPWASIEEFNMAFLALDV